MFFFITPMIKLFPCLPVISFVFVRLTYYALGNFFPFFFFFFFQLLSKIEINRWKFPYIYIFIEYIHINYVNYTRVYNGIEHC